MAGRKPDPERRREILDAVVDRLVERGLHDLSLRPLGADVGVSARVLVYHFGSKENLVSEALSEASRRQRGMFERWVAEEGGAASAELLVRFWRWLSSERMGPYLRLFFEVYSLGLRGRAGFSDYLGRGAVNDWVDFAEGALAGAGLPEGEARSEATLLVASVRGLLLDLLATGERERVDAAMEELARRTERRARGEEDAAVGAQGGDGGR